jgi:hypothetical protein
MHRQRRKFKFFSTKGLFDGIAYSCIRATKSPEAKWLRGFGTSANYYGVGNMCAWAAVDFEHVGSVFTAPMV